MNLYTRVYLRVQRDISQSEPIGRRQIKARQRELHCNAIQVYLTRTHDRHEPGLQGSRQSHNMSKTPSPDYHRMNRKQPLINQHQPLFLGSVLSATVNTWKVWCSH